MRHLIFVMSLRLNWLFLLMSIKNNEDSLNRHARDRGPDRENCTQLAPWYANDVTRSSQVDHTLDTKPS